jgi:hypothetical protein
MSVVSAILGLGGTILEKLLPNRSRAQESNLEINAETEKASGGRMTPRKLLMYVFAYEVAFEVVFRPWIVILAPEVDLPPPMLKDLLVPIATLFGW